METTELSIEPSIAPASDERPIGYLELLNRGGRVVHRLPVHHNQRIHVGRAYDNDLIVDDPYVCPHHLSLLWSDDKLQVTDRGSLNGVEVSERKAPEQPSFLECGEQLRLGRTTLRFRSARFSVAPTQVVGRGLAVFELFGNPLVQGGSFLLLAGLMLLNAYLGSFIEFEALETILEIVVVLIAVMLWATLWSFASRLMLHHWNFWRHCSVVIIGLIVMSFSDELIACFTFAFGLDDILTVLGYLIHYPLFVAVLFLHLHFASSATPKRLFLRAMCVVSICCVLVLTINLSERDDFSYQPYSNPTLKPPVLKLASSQSTDQFFAETTAMLNEVDKQVAEADLP